MVKELQRAFVRMRDENAQRSGLLAPVKNNDIKLKAHRRLKDRGQRCHVSPLSERNGEAAGEENFGAAEEGVPLIRPMPPLLVLEQKDFLKISLSLLRQLPFLQFNPSGGGSGAGLTLQSSFIRRLRLSLCSQHRRVKFMFRQSVHGFPESQKCFSSVKS